MFPPTYLVSPGKARACRHARDARGRRCPTPRSSRLDSAAIRCGGRSSPSGRTAAPPAPSASESRRPPARLRRRLPRRELMQTATGARSYSWTTPLSGRRLQGTADRSPLCVRIPRNGRASAHGIFMNSSRRFSATHGSTSKSATKRYRSATDRGLWGQIRPQTRGHCGRRRGGREPSPSLFRP
jgi:hypothetical protein